MSAWSAQAGDYLLEAGDYAGANAGDCLLEAGDYAGGNAGDYLLEAGDYFAGANAGDCLLEAGDHAVDHVVAGFSSPVCTARYPETPDLTSHDGDDGDDEAEAAASQTSPDGSPRKRRKKTAKTRKRRIPFRSAEHSGRHAVSSVARAARGGRTFSRLLDVRLLDVVLDMGQPASSHTHCVTVCHWWVLSRWLDV